MNERYLALLFFIFLFCSCSKDYELIGLIQSNTNENDRFDQSDEWNKLHPFKNLVVDKDDYTILVAGDSHIGSLTNFTAFLSEAKKSENLAFILVGDLVTGEKKNYEILKDTLPEYEITPHFLIVGNHDLYYAGWKTFYDYFGSSTYYFTVKTPVAKDIYICLDSSSGSLGSRQLDWLENVLKNERNNYRNCFILTHLNFFRKSEKWALYPKINDSDELQTLFTEYNVNMVISGHTHVISTNQIGTTNYLTIRALVDGISNPSFLKLSVKAAKISYLNQKI